jgi:hypothetical protein
MSQYSLEQKRESLARAYAILAETAPAGQRKPAPTHTSQPGIIYKTRVRDDDDGPGPRIVHSTPRTRAVAAKSAPSEMVWWRWVDARIEDGLSAYSKDVGRAIGTKTRETREPLEEENRVLKRELELLRRELDVLRMEVNVKALQEEVRTARAEIPNLAAVEARFDVRQADVEGKQASLERELKITKDKLGRLHVDQSVTDYTLREIERKQRTAPAVELKFQTSSSSFTMKDIHPDALAAWRRFVAQVIADARDDGATSMLISDVVGTA